jgi:hypothetical protein
VFGGFQCRSRWLVKVIPTNVEMDELWTSLNFADVTLEWSLYVSAILVSPLEDQMSEEMFSAQMLPSQRCNLSKCRERQGDGEGRRRAAGTGSNVKVRESMASMQMMTMK